MRREAYYFGEAVGVGVVRAFSVWGWLYRKFDLWVVSGNSWDRAVAYLFIMAVTFLVTVLVLSDVF